MVFVFGDHAYINDSTGNNGVPNLYEICVQSIAKNRNPGVFKNSSLPKSITQDLVSFSYEFMIEQAVIKVIRAMFDELDHDISLIHTDKPKDLKYMLTEYNHGHTNGIQIEVSNDKPIGQGKVSCSYSRPSENLESDVTDQVYGSQRKNSFNLKKEVKGQVEVMFGQLLSRVIKEKKNFAQLI